MYPECGAFVRLRKAYDVNLRQMADIEPTAMPKKFRGLVITMTAGRGHQENTALLFALFTPDTQRRTASNLIVLESNGRTAQ